MGKKPKQLSHEELWDDSALQRSWDDALSEYKLYHSIHARGERVEDVLREAEEKDMAESQNGAAIASDIHISVIQPTNDTHADELEDGEVEEMDSQGQTINTPVLPQPPQVDHPNQMNPPGESKNIAPAVLSNVKDETLKNLMMSWYYAGYYTGLSEGQQQTAIAAASSSKSAVKDRS